MKFQIDRVSQRNNKKPCDEAYKTTYTRIDSRNASSIKEIPAYKNNQELWYSKGTNHRVVNNEITRDFPNTEKWEIDLLDLEALIHFTDKYGSCIVYKNNITIYDDNTE